MGKLTALAISRLVTKGYYGDGDGLWLQVTASGARSWVYRYRAGGRTREMGLGSAKVVSLARAREKAGAAARQRADGIDPLEHRQMIRRTAEIARARLVTFRSAAESYIAGKSGAWRNDKHRAQWASTLETYVYPTIGSFPVQEIDTGLVLKVLEPIWTSKPETASRVRGRIEVILDAAKVRGQRDGENPARWRGHLDKLLTPKSKLQSVRHHPALPFVELPGFMRQLESASGAASLALRFAILTAARTSEVIGARWSEVDMANGIWTVPAGRMKAGREHRIPLSAPAKALLAACNPKEVSPDDFCFAGGSPGRGLSNMAMLKVLMRLKRADLTVHGFRSTFRDWAAETTQHPGEVVEMALAHIVSSKVEAAYRRGDLMEKRRRLMEDWSQFCMASPSANSPPFA